LVTWFASGHDIFPALFSALHHWHDVIKCELTFCKLSSAILASELVSDENVYSGKTDYLFLSFKWDVGEKSEYGRNFHCEFYGPYFLVRLFNYFHFALKKQLHSPLPGYDLQGFKACV
jgi:hypothetical protein